jgi:Immunity protein Imm1
LTFDLSINGHQSKIATVADLRRALAPFADEAFREVSINVPDGSSFLALFNGSSGWLMHLRESGDAGFSSRNPTYQGEPNATLKYQLSNDQIDEYPASWALPEDLVIKALEHFLQFQERPPFVRWHDDGRPKPRPPTASRSP